MNLMAMQAMFNTYDAGTETALGGNEAIQMIQQRINQAHPMFKIIMLDYDMPDLDGP